MSTGGAYTTDVFEGVCIAWRPCRVTESFVSSVTEELPVELADFLMFASISLNRKLLSNSAARSTPSPFSAITPKVKCSVPSGRMASGGTAKLIGFVTSALNDARLLLNCVPVSGMHRKCVGAVLGGIMGNTKLYKVNKPVEC